MVARLQLEHRINDFGPDDQEIIGLYGGAWRPFGRLRDQGRSMTLVISPDAKKRPGDLAEVLRLGWDVPAPYAGGPLDAERLIDLPENGD